MVVVSWDGRSLTKFERRTCGQRRLQLTFKTDLFPDRDRKLIRAVEPWKAKRNKNQIHIAESSFMGRQRHQLSHLIPALLSHNPFSTPAFYHHNPHKRCLLEVSFLVSREFSTSSFLEASFKLFWFLDESSLGLFLKQAFLVPRQIFPSPFLEASFLISRRFFPFIYFNNYTRLSGQTVFSEPLLPRSAINSSKLSRWPCCQLHLHHIT